MAVNTLSKNSVSGTIRKADGTNFSDVIVKVYSKSLLMENLLDTAIADDHGGEFNNGSHWRKIEANALCAASCAVVEIIFNNT